MKWNSWRALYKESVTYIGPKLSTYSQFKSLLEPEKYLHVINSFWARKHPAKFRTSNHDLATEKGRHAKLERHRRMCNMCNLGCVEDEYNFILICPKYEYLREKYLPWRFGNFPSTAKFIDLMSSNNDQIVISLSTFIYQAFKVRKHADRCTCWQTRFFEFSYSELKWLSISYCYLYHCQQFM